MIFIQNIWSLLLEMSPFLLMGFLFSGILSVVLTVDTITKYLGSNSFRSIFLASLFGVPLPLCSCGVIPVFSYLRKHGASKSSTTSFLISTPQTGVDSILVTYSLLGPIFAIFRPIIAFISGLIGGTLISVLDSDYDDTIDKSIECDEDCCDEESSTIYRIFNYGFVKLPQDIVTPLIVGIICAVLISYFIPHNYFENIGTGILGMFIMLILGIPSYICATASVPIALALHLKGFSMGALIVFLMSGPATNMATISVAIKQLGKKSAVIYLFSIILCSFSAGLIFDFLFPELQVEQALNSSMHMLPYWLQSISVLALVLILANALRLSYTKNESIEEGNNQQTLFIKGMTCNHCVESVTKSLNKISGVKVLGLNLKSGKATIDCEPKNMSLVKQVIDDLGYNIKE